MRTFLARIFSTGRLAWAIAAVLAIALVLVATDTVHLASLHLSSSYAERSTELTNADRSEPLRMSLEAQYPGPLQDTIVQRWRDPVDGTVCYIYLPVAVAHAAGPNGLVQYGAAHIGTISCLRP
jgi:hypothetical protein